VVAAFIEFDDELSMKSSVAHALRQKATPDNLFVEEVRDDALAADESKNMYEELKQKYFFARTEVGKCPVETCWNGTVSYIISGRPKSILDCIQTRHITNFERAQPDSHREW
jgi:hypothetical protein